jgi:hypothetical protein
MGHVIGGLAGIIVGLAFILFRRWIADSTIEARNRLYGTRFGERTKKIYRWLTLIMGIAVLAYSILAIFGVVK